MDIHFAEPQWIHLLWAVLVFVASLGWLERRGGDALDRFVSDALKSRLLVGPSRGQRAARITFLGLVGVCLTLALMRPQWGLELVESRRTGAEIMVCLDVSQSMLAEDVAPNRLDRAKAEVRDLLDLLDGDQVGLIVFAGRASVLSPLTPDFGFLRLALDDARPSSVGRGGTRLEEPIRKAVAGFGDSGDVSRSILLITDGEDHDSFPLEAAKEAAERGVRILAVGFGDESGTEIPITDPKTGARTLLKDADGTVVRSRLDGDLLRELALLTNGAYIPAGTGFLDLESIYQRHIAPLTRGQLDGRTRTVRNDAFQWAVLLALLALFGAVFSTARSAPARGREYGGGTVAPAVALTVSVLLSTLATLAMAQEPAQIQDPVTTGDGAGEATAQGAQEETQGTDEDVASDDGIEVPEEPRAAYNEGISRLEAGDIEAATRLLESAREHAGTDGEARFRATYNLGWTEVSAADKLLESEPADALDRLYRAAGWFREAVDLRPGHDDARYNLEVVMRRALELADSLAKRDEGDLRTKLDALVKAQREFLGALREGVAAQHATDNTNVTPELRGQFRSLAAQELTVSADADQLSEQATRELEGILARSDEEQTPEEAIRSTNLEAVVGHLHRARERIGQARTRLRRMQGERAYRRAAAALGELQRARDQLLEPVARLDALLADGMEVAQLTGLKAALERGIGDLESGTPVPRWLTLTYLAEAQERLEMRTGELHTVLASGLASHDRTPRADANSAEQAFDADQARLVEQLREATPMIGEARSSFELATNALAAERLREALDAQGKGLEALATAREQFLDLRRLIELTYGEEQRVAGLIAEDSIGVATTSGGPSPAESNAAPTEEATALGASLHERNVERTVRLGQMLSTAMVDAMERGPQVEANGGEPPSSVDDDAQRRHFERAYEHLRLAQDSMHAATRTFGEVLDPGASEADSGDALQATRSSVELSLGHLEELRRLFFSVLEHLQDTAQRQQALADDTESVAAFDDPTDPEATARKSGPISHRQGNLAATADGISEALREQASAPPPDQGPPDEPTREPDVERLTQAADLVAEAGGSMTEAAERLSDEPPVLDGARNSQDEALNALLEAIALLQDPQDSRQNGDQQEQAEQQEDGGGNEQQQREEKDASATDLARLLQGVRDREARRREERARGVSRGYEPVEKDW